MQQISASVPDSVLNLLRTISEQTGEPVSSIANRLIREGLQNELDFLNRAQVYANLVQKNKD